MKFEEKDIRVGDDLVSYVDEGADGSNTIVCIHGFPFNKWMWENQIDLLKENYRVRLTITRPSETICTRFTIPIFTPDSHTLSPSFKPSTFLKTADTVKVLLNIFPSRPK